MRSPLSRPVGIVASDDANAGNARRPDNTRRARASEWLRVGGAGAVTLSAPAYRSLVAVDCFLGCGHTVAARVIDELSTQDAADLIGAPKTYLVWLLESAATACHRLDAPFGAKQPRERL